MKIGALQIINAANGQTSNAVLGGTNPTRIGWTVGKFDVEIDMDGQEIPKFQSHGQWQNYEYVRRMLINQEGLIIGANAADYNWQRRGLMLAALTDPGTQLANTPWHCELYATPVGHPQLYAQVVLTSSSMPSVAADGPMQSPYQLQWRNDFGYWRLASDKTTVYKI